jgi:hypothetical protein
MWHRRRDVLSLLQTRAADDVIPSKTRLVASVHVASKDTSADNAGAVRDGEVNLTFEQGRMEWVRGPAGGIGEECR